MSLKVLYVSLYGGDVKDVASENPIKVPFNSGFAVIAKVKSRKQFSEITGCSVSFLTSYSSETGNSFDLAVVENFEPGTVFVRPFGDRETYYRALGLNESRSSILFDSSRADLTFKKKDFGL